jgi:flagellar protein FliS
VSKNKLQTYAQIGNHSRVESASPHRLIQLLFEGALESLAVAQGAMDRGDIESRGAAITKALNILSGLRDSLNPAAGSSLPYDLDRLYEYMQRRLLEAHAQNQAEGLSEVADLLRTVKSGWDGIAEQ